MHEPGHTVLCPSPSFLIVAPRLGLCHSPPLQLPAGRHAHGLRGGAAAAADGLHSLDDFVALQHLTEDDMLAIQPARRCCAQEELRTVRVGAGVGHRQRSRTEVLAGLASEGLIGEFSAVDGLATSTIAVSEVATLAHELRDHTVERAARVAEPLLARAQRTKVLGRLGDGIGKELHRHAAGALTTDLDIHPNLRVGGNGGVVRLVGHYA
ncbi:cyclophilin a, putative [Leishmania tarentolae]|uniref:Cyclophilin a, putative n=1 Tax=Leishmania tarentolae TaxID=5689 RepID=A0A640KHI9_LEITA|nr:cyclophilin a, putative [Leishmania tarentolae]